MICKSLSVLLLLAVGTAMGHDNPAATAMIALEDRPEVASFYGSVLQYVNIETMLGGDFAGTIFAPTNKAWKKFMDATRSAGIPMTTDTLEDVLLYHIVPGPPAPVTSLNDDQIFVTSLGKTLTAQYTDGKLTIDGIGSDAGIQTADIHVGPAHYGVIHVVDTVLVPFELPKGSGKGKDTVQAQNIFDSVGDAVSGAVDAVGNAASDAVDAVQSGVGTAVGATEGAASDAQEAASDVADNVATEGTAAVDAAEQAANNAAEAAQNAANDAAEAVDNAVNEAVDDAVNDAANDATDAANDAADAAVDAADEVNQAVDEAVGSVTGGTGGGSTAMPEGGEPEGDSMPIPLSPALVGGADVFASAENNNLTALLAAISAAGLESELVGFNGTLFGPTNQAFEAFLTSSDLSLSDLPEEALETLAEILSYHVSPMYLEDEDLVDGLEIPTLLGPTITVVMKDGGVFLMDVAGNEVAIVGTEMPAGTNAIIHAIDGILMPFSAPVPAPAPVAPPSGATSILASAAGIAASLLAAVLFM